MPRKSKYENTDVLFSKNETFKRFKKVWHIGKYIRLSKEDGDDKDESNSVVSQDKILDDLIMDLAQNSEDEFVVYDTYIDDGFSGTDFNRPSFQRLLRDMKDNRINMIITKDLSRLGRNYIEVGNYIEQIFPLFNIRFIAINDNVDSFRDPTSTNTILVPFKNLINDEYCRDTSIKIRSALDGRKKKRRIYRSISVIWIYKRSK